MSDWRPRDPTGAESGGPPPPGWGTPFPPEKPRRDAPESAPAPAAAYQAPYGATAAPQPPYGATAAPQAPYGAAPAPTLPNGRQPYGAAPASPAVPGVPPQYSGPSTNQYTGTPAAPGAPAGYSPHSYAAAAVPGAPLFAPLPDPMTENRRHLDWRRIRATRFDGLLMVLPSLAILAVFRRQLVTAWFLVMALNLSYHFVMETLCGQTFGKRRRSLRVVKRDGSPAGASAIAARTVFRIIDAQFLYLVGLITMVITGKKRQRLGDIAGGTIVREDDRPWKPAPASPLLVIYPILWVAGALFFGHMLDPKPVTLTADPYLQQVDRTCEFGLLAQRVGGAGGSFQSIQDLSLQETRALESMPQAPTPEAAYGLSVVLKWRHKIDNTAAKIESDARASQDPQSMLQHELPLLLDVIKRSDKHMARLGLPHCIEGPGYVASG